jgi:hypothetical protein
MSSSANPIKALARRFVSLPPPMRMKLTKKLLELYGSDRAEGGKNFLEQFWDVVEEAHGDRPRAANPFRAEKGSKSRLKAAAETDEQDGCLTWHSYQSNLLPLF